MLILTIDSLKRIGFRLLQLFERERMVNSYYLCMRVCPFIQSSLLSSIHPSIKLQGGPKGYVYILFDCDKSVKELLKQCTHDYSNGGEYYYKMSSRRMRCKEVQVCTSGALDCCSFSRRW